MRKRDVMGAILGRTCPRRTADGNANQLDTFIEAAV